MCGRLVQHRAAEQASRLFGLPPPPDIGSRFNVAPTFPLVVIRSTEPGVTEWSLPRWGLIPHWAKDLKTGYKMINAKAETVASKPAYRGPFRYRRCVIPSDGFYEWHVENQHKQPYFIRARGDEPLLLAGLWDYWEGDGQGLETCTIVTTAANAALGALHDRMPALLTAEGAHQWLDPALQDTRRLTLLLEPVESPLSFYKVSTRVNKPMHDDPALIEPFEQTRVPRED